MALPLRGIAGVDLNAGVEFRITRQLNLWFQMNNLFNDKYERWHQYQVYGFNLLGGIVFSFGQKVDSRSNGTVGSGSTEIINSQRMTPLAYGPPAGGPV